MKPSCRGALNWRLCDDHLIKAITFLQLLCGRELPGECWVPAEKRESTGCWCVFKAPHVLERAGGCAAALADCSGEKGRGLCLHAGMLLLYYGANQGNSKLPVCKEEMAWFWDGALQNCKSCRCLSSNSTEGWWQSHCRAEGQTHIFNPTKYANVLCWLKLREIGFESNLFALSFTESWKWGALHLRSHQAMVQLLETSPYPCGWGIQVGNALCQRAQGKMQSCTHLDFREVKSSR